MLEWWPYSITSFTNANLFHSGKTSNELSENITWNWIDLYNFCLCSCQPFCFISLHHHNLDTFTSMSFNWDLSWCLHDLWSSSLMLSLWLSLMLRPIRMGSQDSVQELLGNRLTPSLLGGNLCCVNQCFPFILQKPNMLYNKSWKL